MDEQNEYHTARQGLDESEHILAQTQFEGDIYAIVYDSKQKSGRNIYCYHWNTNTDNSGGYWLLVMTKGNNIRQRYTIIHNAACYLYDLFPYDKYDFWALTDVEGRYEPPTEWNFVRPQGWQQSVTFNEIVGKLAVDTHETTEPPTVDKGCYNCIHSRDNKADGKPCEVVNECSNSGNNSKWQLFERDCTNCAHSSYNNGGSSCGQGACNDEQQPPLQKWALYRQPVEATTTAAVNKTGDCGTCRYSWKNNGTTNDCLSYRQSLGVNGHCNRGDQWAPIEAPSPVATKGDGSINHYDVWLTNQPSITTNFIPTSVTEMAIDVDKIARLEADKAALQQQVTDHEQHITKLATEVEQQFRLINDLAADKAELQRQTARAVESWKSKEQRINDLITDNNAKYDTINAQKQQITELIITNQQWAADKIASRRSDKVWFSKLDRLIIGALAIGVIGLALLLGLISGLQYLHIGINFALIGQLLCYIFLGLLVVFWYGGGIVAMFIEDGGEFEWRPVTERFSSPIIYLLWTLKWMSAIMWLTTVIGFIGLIILAGLINFNIIIIGG